MGLTNPPKHILWRGYLCCFNNSPLLWNINNLLYSFKLSWYRIILLMQTNNVLEFQNCCLKFVQFGVVIQTSHGGDQKRNIFQKLLFLNDSAKLLWKIPWLKVSSLHCSFSLIWFVFIQWSIFQLAKFY